jgi:predicted transcriptional regulator
MKDIVNSFKAHLNEKTTSPVIGPFIFYWIVCNYQFMIILVDGDLKPNEKFELIKVIYPSEIYTPWIGLDIHYQTLLSNGLLVPLLITLIYIFIIPYPTKFIYKFWKKRKKDLITIKNGIDDDTPIGQEQSKKLRNSLYELQNKYESQFEEITNLKSLINSTDSLPKIKETTSTNAIPINYSTEENNKLKEAFSNHKSLFVNHIEIKILEKIEKTNNCTIDNIDNILDNMNELEKYTDKLLSNKLITFDEQEEIFRITKKGEKAIEKFHEEEIPF